MIPLLLISSVPRVRVCTSGGEGACSHGGGASALAALHVLSPDPNAIELSRCSCLAQCDRGTVAQLFLEEEKAGGRFFHRLNDARAASALLQAAGLRVEKELVEAVGQAEVGHSLAAVGRPVDALKAYNGAFSHAVNIGLAVQWRSLPASVLRVQQRRPVKRPATTAAQVAWLAQLMVARSRTYSLLSQQGWVRASQRALEDAQYAVQLCGSRAEVDLKVRAIAWERLAETYESVRNIKGAILAYEQLLIIEPSFDPRLSPALSAKRGVQELVLISHRRGLEGAVEVRKGLRQAEKASRESITSRALQDVERLRNLVDKDIQTIERVAEERSLRGGSGPRDTFASRAMRDVRTMRQVVFSDINTLQMQILRGDPTVTFLRTLQNALDTRGGQCQPERRLSTLQQLSELADLSAGDIPADQQAFWLREQFESGALPSDPVLVRSLVEQARQNPDVITRLMADAVRARAPPSASSMRLDAAGGASA